MDDPEGRARFNAFAQGARRAARPAVPEGEHKVGVPDDLAVAHERSEAPVPIIIGPEDADRQP